MQQQQEFSMASSNKVLCSIHIKFREGVATFDRDRIFALCLQLPLPDTSDNGTKLLRADFIRAPRVGKNIADIVGYILFNDLNDAQVFHLSEKFNTFRNNVAKCADISIGDTLAPRELFAA